MADSPFVRPMLRGDVPGVVALQKLAFPPPFSEDLLWDAEHLERHIELFPAGQFVAEVEGRIVGSCSNTQISEACWEAHEGWSDTVGGPFLDSFTPSGSTLYGLDISVDPDFRRIGLGRRFYETRFERVRSSALARYGTACRMPDFASYTGSVHDHARAVVAGERIDRTLTPLLRYGLTFLGVVENYMEDAESGNAAALLEWKP